MEAAHVARSGLLAALVLGGALSGCSAGKGGVLDLSWTPPTTNTDGSPAGDVVAYRVYYGTQPSPCPGGPFITDTDYSLTLSDGTVVTGAQVKQDIHDWLAAGAPNIPVPPSA